MGLEVEELSLACIGLGLDREIEVKPPGKS